MIELNNKKMLLFKILVMNMYTVLLHQSIQNIVCKYLVEDYEKSYGEEKIIFNSNFF